MDADNNGLSFRFANCSYDPASRRLSMGRRSRRLRPQTAKLLLLLLRRPRGVVTREEIRQALWGDKFVVEFDLGISACIKQLRHDLRDSATQPRFIETIPREGYRLVCDAIESTAADSAAVIAAPHATRHPTLRWIWLLVGCALLLVSLAVWLRWPGEPPAPRREMIAVLPFDIYGAADTAQARMLTAAALEDIVTVFARARPQRLGVISATSTRTLGRHEKTVGEIRSQFAVDFVMDGTMRRVAQKWVVSVSLSRAADQSWVWGGVIEVPLASDKVSKRLAVSLQQSLLPVLLDETDQSPGALEVRTPRQ